MILPTTRQIKKSQAKGISYPDSSRMVAKYVI
jgi:hypothetical protein